jgi:hypothetical protein
LSASSILFIDIMPPIELPRAEARGFFGPLEAISVPLRSKRPFIPGLKRPGVSGRF